jgi:hypothetical protein
MVVPRETEMTKENAVLRLMFVAFYLFVTSQCFKVGQRRIKTHDCEFYLEQQ